MTRRLQFSLRGLAIWMGLVCIGLVATQRCFAIRDNLLYLEVCLMVAGASFGGSTGLLFGRPIRGAVVGLIAVPIIATAVTFAVVAWLLVISAGDAMSVKKLAENRPSHSPGIKQGDDRHGSKRRRAAAKGRKTRRKPIKPPTWYKTGIGGQGPEYMGDQPHRLARGKDKMQK